MTTTNISKSRLWIGRIMSGLVILFMLFDAIGKFIKPEEAVNITVNELGYSEDHLLIMGVLALVSTLLYTFPVTSVLGAILLTGYYGGAIATHLRVDNPLFSHMLFPVYLAILMWGGIWLRNERLRALFPINRNLTE